MVSIGGDRDGTFSSALAATPSSPGPRWPRRCPQAARVRTGRAAIAQAAQVSPSSDRPHASAGSSRPHSGTGRAGRKSRCHRVGRAVVAQAARVRIGHAAVRRPLASAQTAQVGRSCPDRSRLAAAGSLPHLPPRWLTFGRVAVQATQAPCPHRRVRSLSLATPACVLQNHVAGREG